MDQLAASGLRDACCCGVRYFHKGVASLAIVGGAVAVLARFGTAALLAVAAFGAACGADDEVLLWASAEVTAQKTSANDHKAESSQWDCLRDDEFISTNRQRLLLHVPFGFEKLHKAGVGIGSRW